MYNKENFIVIIKNVKTVTKKEKLMDEKQLKQLADSLTIKEKIAQTVQLNGDLFTDSDVMNTGPTKELGFPDDFDLSQIGSIYNINEPEKLKKIQTKIMKESSKKNPAPLYVGCYLWFSHHFSYPTSTSGIV